MILSSLYYLALGEYKLENFAAAKEYITTLLQVEPSNNQALSLRDHINDRITQDGLFGMAIVGGAITVVGAIAAALFAGGKKRN
jgi:fission 1 protein